MTYRRTRECRTTLGLVTGGLVFLLMLAGGSTGRSESRLMRLPLVDAELPASAPESVPQSAPASVLESTSASAPELALPEEDFYCSKVARECCWNWQVLPDGLIYRTYMAGTKEPRMSAVWNHDNNEGWIWDISLGGRMGILRYGSSDPYRPQGWQVDIEGASQPRLDLLESLDLQAADFRFGVPLTYGRGPYEMKLAYYHISSHLGDEILLKHPDEVTRINYSRDAIVWGHSYYLVEMLRLYGEVAWAFHIDGGDQPWEFQFGMEYSPDGPTRDGAVPFVAINAHLREAVDFGGNVTVQTGWLWRGPSGRMFRLGMQYLYGKSDQYEFFRRNEDKLGLGIWIDY